jgi:hypothetical protein
MTLALSDPLTSTDSEPQGESAGWDEKLIALLALLTAADLLLAESLWDTFAPRGYAGLLLAVAVDDAKETPVAEGFWFSRRQQRYGIGLRGAIPIAAVRVAFATVVAGVAARMAADARQMARGAIDIAQWQNGAAAIVKALAVASAAAGKGGTGELTGDDQIAVAESLEFHFAKLERFASQIERRAIVTVPDALARRAGLYALSAGTLFEQFRVLGHETAGFTLYKNVLGDAEHCQHDPRRPDVADCPSLSAEGFVPIGTLPDIGARLCLWNCKCHWEFRRSNDDG